MVTPVRKNKKTVFADYTKGSLHKHIFYVLLSLACAAIVRNLVQIVDMLFLSWLNDHNITAGVSASNAVLKSVFPVGAGMGVATGTIVGHYMGSQNIKGVKRLLVHAVTISLTLSSVLCIIAFIFKKQFFFDFLKGEKDVYPYFVRYLIPMLIGVPLMNLNLLFTTVRSSIGDLKGTLYLTLMMSCTNAALDPIFIFVFHWNSFGAGFASLLSGIVIIIIGYVRFKYKFKVWGKIRPKKFMTDLKILMKYFVPATLTVISPSLFAILNIKIASSYGTEVVSTIGMINQVVQLCIGTVIFNMTGSVTPIVAQNYAKGEYGRIIKVLQSAIFIVVVFICITALIFNLGGSRFIAFAFHLKGLSHTLMVTYFNYIAEGWLFTGICFACIGCLNAIGKPTYSTFLNVFRMLLLGIPLMFIFNAYLPSHYFLLGPLSPYLGSMTAGFIASIIACIAVVKIIHNLQLKKPHPNVGK